MKTLPLTKVRSISPEVIIKLAVPNRKLLTTALSVLLLALLFCAPSQAQKKDALWQTYMDAAAKADARNNYAEAERLYKLAQVRTSAFGELDERRISTLAGLAGLYLKWPGKAAEAKPLYQQITTLLDKGAGADSLPNAARLFSLAQLYQNKVGAKEAEPLHLHALAIYRKGMRPGDMNVVNYLFSLGSNYFAQNNTEDAKKIFKETVELLNSDPVRSGQSSAAYARAYLLLILRSEKEYQEAEMYGKRSLEVMEKYRGRNHNEVSSMHKAMHFLYAREEKRYSEAEAEIKRAIEIDEYVYGPMSLNVRYDLTLLGDHYFNQARYAEATAQYQRALDILDKHPKAPLSDVNSDGYFLMMLHHRQREPAEAEAVCQRVRGIFAKKLPPSPSNNLQANECLEGAYYLSGNYFAEAEILKDSIMHAEKLGVEGEATLADRLITLGSSYLRQRKYELALTTLQRAEKIYTKNSLPLPPTLHFNLARSHYFLGKYAESEPLFLKALELAGQKKDAGSVNLTAWFGKGYALLLYTQGKTAQADEMFQKAVEGLKSDKVSGERDVASSWHELATLFAAQGKYAEAERLFQQAKETRERVLPPGHDDIATTLEGYAALLKKMGRASEASPLERQAEAIRAKHAAH